MNPSCLCLVGSSHNNTRGLVSHFLFFKPNGEQTESALAARGNIAVVFLMTSDLSLAGLAPCQTSHSVLCVWVEECAGLQRAH